MRGGNATKKKMKPVKPGRALVYGILVVGAFLALFPFIWMILTSFKGAAEAM